MPLGLLKHAETFPYAGVVPGIALHGFGMQKEDPLQIPAIHVKAEFAVYPLLHIGMQETPLVKPAQCAYDPYNKGFKGTVWQIVAEAI